MKFVYIETYGCSANQNNSEIIAGILMQAGLEIVSTAEAADIIILNTCIVKVPTENKIIFRIKQLQKKYSNKLLVVAGCMPDIHSSLIRQIAPSALLIGSHHVHEIAKLLKKKIEGKGQDLVAHMDEIKLCMPKLNHNKIIGITQILEGCLGECSYCITRFAKGRLFSYPQDKIIENIQKDIKAGCKEIWLTSQDNAAYGRDNDKSNDQKIKSKLPRLLKNILTLDGNFKVRLGMMNPNHVLPVLDELLECFKDEKMFKFLHLPLQSGSDRVLKGMNRKYSVKDFLMIIKKFRKEFPLGTVSTDIIVGYPTETGSDFNETVKIIQEVKPQLLNISQFYAHKGTSASGLKQLNAKIMNKRSAMLTELHSGISLAENKKLLGKELSVLVDKHGFGKTWLCRSDEYNLVAVCSDKNLLGKFLNVRVKEAKQNYIIGEII